MTTKETTPMDEASDLKSMAVEEIVKLWLSPRTKTYGHKNFAEQIRELKIGAAHD